MDRRIVLAYDGSINADWVARYAMQMVAATPCQQLLLIHILDGSFTRERIETKFATIAAECKQHGITSQCLVLAPSGDVFTSLLQAIPPGKQCFCLCGTRIALKEEGFLVGTIAERLLRCERFNVMAIRVVNPGLLGCPRTLLFPLAGHPRGFEAALPFLQMLAASIKRLYLLRVMTVNSFHFRYISAIAAKKRIAEGHDYLRRIEAEIQRQTSGASWHLDRHVVLSDDWAKEILIQAGKINAAMILLGATERNLPVRFFYGNRMEQILRTTSCDVGIYRKL
jgi:nucleotide-binding universal stress UspA family protein